MKKFIILCLSFYAYATYGCHREDYVYHPSSESIDQFTLENIITTKNNPNEEEKNHQKPSPFHKILEIDDHTFSRISELLFSPLQNLLISNSKATQRALTYANTLCYQETLQNYDIAFHTLHPFTEFTKSAAFFGFIAYAFDKKIELFVKISGNQIQKFRCFNPNSFQTPHIKLLFSNDGCYILHEKTDFLG